MVRRKGALLDIHSRGLEVHVVMDEAETQLHGSVRLAMRTLLLLFVAACNRFGNVEARADASDEIADGTDTPPMHVDDGTPTRAPCTGSFGSALTKTFGRLDGYLVAIVVPGGSQCNSDNDHVLLQVNAGGAIYEIAVNVGAPDQEDVESTAIELPLPGPAWQEGWHPGLTFDYPSVGLKASDFTLATRAANTQAIVTDLAAANHVSVFATGWGGGGAHLVHRNGGGRDGALITEPLSRPSHLRLFAFSNQTF